MALIRENTKFMILKHIQRLEKIHQWTISYFWISLKLILHVFSKAKRDWYLSRQREVKDRTHF
jgi:hypothetical protein